MDGSYDIGLQRLTSDDWENDDIFVLLLLEDAGLVFDRDHETITEVLAESDNTEASGTGYERKAIPSPAATIIGNNQVRLTHDNIVYTDIDAGEIGAAVYYIEDDTNDGDRVPLFFKKLAPHVTDGETIPYRVPLGVVILSDLDE